MNSFKKILLTTAIITGNYTFSQQTVVLTDLPATYNQSYDLRGVWSIKNNEDNKSFVINGSQIINNTNSRSNDLELTVHFIPVDPEKKSTVRIDANKLTHKLNKETVLGQVDGNRNSFNNIRIAFTQLEISYLPHGSYKTIVVLRDKNTKEIKNYKVLDNRLEYIDDHYELVKENSYMINGEKADNTLSNVYSTVKSSLSLAYVPNQKVLAGDWKLDVDFSTLSVVINGNNNSIQNKTLSDTNELKLLVYFSENPANEFTTVEGYELLNVDIKPISKISELKNPVIKTNITKAIPSGEYYPILVLTEADENGEYKVKSAIRFTDKYTL